MKSVSSALLVSALVMACVEGATAPYLTTGAHAATGSATAATRFLVLAADGADPSAVSTGIEVAGGTIVDSYAQISVFVVESSNPGFRTAAAATAGVQTVLPDETVDAWTETTGSEDAGARVALLDAGIDHDHPELAPNLNFP